MPAATTTFKIPDGLQPALKAAGIDPAAVLRKSGLPLTLWTSGKGMVTTEQLFGLWRAAGELSTDPSAGLRMPGLVPVAQHHPVSIAAQHARTFRDGLQRLARYKSLCCGEEMRFTESREECRVELHWISSGESAPPLLIDAVFASALELGRRGSGRPLHPLRVELARKAEHREIHESHYGCPVKFKAPHNAIVFRAADLNLPFITYNAALLEMLSPQLDRELAQRKAEQTPASKARWVLRRLLGGHRPDIVTVAKELGMSSRTLQRRITEEGTSFRQLVSDARHELARHYLAVPSLELGETACLLGYEDPNSFFRAFREWEGMTPGEWKASNKGGG
ncbi:MAG: AraC family transcriptional regulator [Chthoniobacteraceae bacterium]